MTATLRDLLNLVFRFKRALIIFWAVALIAIVVFYTQTARKYDSKARILVSLGSESSGRADYLNNKGMQLMQREQQIHNEQQILLSDYVLLTTAKWILGEPTPGDPPPPLGADVARARRFFKGEEPEPTLLLKLFDHIGKGVKAVLKAVIRDHKESESTEATKLATTLAATLDAKTIFNSDALDVSFRYRDARVSQTVLRLILAAYMDHHIAVFQNTGESDLLKSELDRSVNLYQQRLNEMANFMATHHIFSEDSQVTSLIQQRQQISQSQSEAAAESDAASARVLTFQGLNGTIKRYETYSTTESHSKVYDELQTKLNEAQLQEQQILNSHPTESRIYQDHLQVLRRIHELLDYQPATLSDQKEERRSGASELVEQQLINSEATKHSADARREQLKLQLNDVNQSINDYAKNLPGYDLIKLNLNLSKDQSEKMGEAYVNSQLRVLTAQNAITDISVIDNPSWQPDPSSPKKSMVALLSIVLLFLGSIAVVLAAAGLDQTVGDRRTTEAAFGVPVAAMLPMVSSEPGDAPRLREPETENEFARIYTSVRQTSKPGVVILLAGSNGGEGLSLIGYEIARFLGRGGSSKTALLDLTSNPGEITPRNDEEPVLLSLPGRETWPKEGVSVVPGSERVTDTAGLMAAWRNEFTYIVVASRATKDIYRIVEILPSISATFLVIEAGRTRRATVSSTLDLLHTHGLERIQIILNKRTFHVPEWLARHI